MKRDRQQEVKDTSKVAEEDLKNLSAKNQLIELELKELRELYVKEKKRNNRFEQEVDDLKSDLKKMSYASVKSSNTNTNFNKIEGKGFQNPTDNFSMRETIYNRDEPDFSLIDDMKKQIESLAGINSNSSKNYINWNQEINTLSNEFKYNQN